MRRLLKLSAFAIFLLVTLTSSAQIDPASAIGLGVGLGRDIAGKIKDDKKKKAIENSISEVEINGTMVKVLRVPEEKIISNAKGYIVRIQNQLDNFYKLYKINEHLDIPYYFDDIITLKTLDKDWATEYYDNEVKEYRKYEQELTLTEKRIKDSIETARRVEQKRIFDSLQLARRKYEDSLAYAERVEGYLFINKEFALLKDKASEKGKTIGKVYLGSYLKVLGYSDNSPYVKVTLQDIEGYVNKDDLTDSIDKIQAANADIATYKSRRYYKYEPNYEYVPEQQQFVISSVASGNSSKTKSPQTKKQPVARSVRYIRGPRGGCYYMSGSSKVYVDRSLCK